MMWSAEYNPTRTSKEDASVEQGRREIVNDGCKKISSDKRHYSSTVRQREAEYGDEYAERNLRKSGVTR